MALLYNVSEGYLLFGTTMHFCGILLSYLSQGKLIFNITISCYNITCIVIFCPSLVFKIIFLLVFKIIADLEGDE